MSLLSQARGLPRSVFQTVVPQSIPSQVWIPEGTELPTITGVAQPRLTAAEILNRARAAVLARRREQQQQGVVPYIPAQPAIVDDVMRTTLSRANLPQPSMSRDVTTVQQRPTGGVIANYGPSERAIKGQYGVGSATSEKKGPTMIEGMPAAKWFQEAANRQGQRVVVGGYDKGSIFEPKTKKKA